MTIGFDGERDLLAYAVNHDKPQDLVLRLFVNDWQPDTLDSADNYTEVEGGGYAPIVLKGSGWSVEDVARYPEQVFTFKTAMGMVYGYYLTRAKSGKLAWAGRFTDGPYEITRAGDKIKIITRLELRRYRAELKVESSINQGH